MKRNAKNHPPGIGNLSELRHRCQRLQAILIKNGKADRDLLKPYAGKKAPATLNANHMIALLNSGQYSQADSISDFLPDTPDTHMLKIVTATLNSDYNQDNFNAIAATGLRNEVVMLHGHEAQRGGLEALEGTA